MIFNGQMKKVLTGCIALVIVMSCFTTTGFAKTKTPDKEASSILTEWKQRGITENDPYIKTSLNDDITKAEFIAFIDQIFGYHEEGKEKYKDVQSGAWYEAGIKRALEAGIIEADSNKKVKPLSILTSQQAALIISTVFYTSVDNKKLKLSGKLTRADAIILIDSIMGELYDKNTKSSGTYNSNLVINTSNVSLKNIRIKGNLYLTQGIDDGRVSLQNVTVDGNIYILGGGEQGITLKNSLVKGTVYIEKNDGQVGLVTKGTTVISDTELHSGAVLSSDQTSNQSYQQVRITEVPKGQTVTLRGTFGTVSANVAGADIDLINGTIKKLLIGAVADIDLKEGTVSNIDVTADGAVIHVGTNSAVMTLTANTPVKVTGQGVITTANIKANGVSIEQTPEATNLSDGITATIGGAALTKQREVPSDGSTGTVPTGPSAKEIADSSIADAKALLPGSFTAVEGTDTNLLTSLGSITGMSTTGVTLSISTSSNALVVSGGAITYGSSQISGNVTISIAKTNGTTVTKTISVVVPKGINSYIADAKALLPGSFTAVEGTDTNILTSLSSITGMSATGVTLSISTISNAQVVSSGAITYGSRQITGNVIISVAKTNGTTVTKTISVIVPKSADSCINDAGELIPNTYTAVDGTDTNLLTSVGNIAGMSANGVTLSISISSNAQVSNSGIITYTGSEISGNVTVSISKLFGTTITKTINVVIPRSADSFISEAKLLIPGTFSAVQGTNENLLTDLNSISGMSDTGVTLSIQASDSLLLMSSGKILYGSTAVTAQVTVAIAKAGGVTQYTNITVEIPIGQGASLTFFAAFSNARISPLPVTYYYYIKLNGDTFNTTNENLIGSHIHVLGTVRGNSSYYYDNTEIAVDCESTTFTLIYIDKDVLTSGYDSKPMIP